VIIDTSALVAILRDEPEAAIFLGMLDEALHARLSAVSYVEAAAVLTGRDLEASRRYDDFLRQAQIDVQPVSTNQAFIARQAYREFGKGSGHPARLNFGDCFAYALAKELSEPLLFKGDDFSKTDVLCADV
jgi:ribonuclease VapC